LEKQYHFYESKAKLLFFILFSLACSLFFSYGLYSLWKSDEPFSNMLFFFFGFCLFILLAITLTRRFFRNKPVITINSDGIESFYLSNLFIPWDDIEGFLPYTYNNQPYLGVILKDDEKYFNELSKYKQRLAIINVKMGLPPFNLVVASLKESPESLFDKLSEFNATFLIRN